MYVARNEREPNFLSSDSLNSFGIAHGGKYSKVLKMTASVFFRFLNKIFIMREMSHVWAKSHGLLLFYILHEVRF